MRAGLSEAETVELLEERHVDAFELTEAGVGWRGHRVSREALAAVRQGFATSYGSCSFREPVDELRDLGWL